MSLVEYIYKNPLLFRCRSLYLRIDLEVHHSTFTASTNPDCTEQTAAASPSKTNYGTKYVKKTSS